MSDEFLVKAAEEQKLTVNMQELGDLTQQLVELRNQITMKELELAALNLQETKLSKEVFPQYLAKYGFKDLSLLDGRKITIKKDICGLLTFDFSYQHLKSDVSDSCCSGIWEWNMCIAD